MIFYYVAFFVFCCAALYFAGNWVVSGMSRVAKFFGWNEFVVAFFVMAMAASLPNLFLAIVSVINDVPELSLGDVMGGNVVDLTLAVALAAFFSRDGIGAKNKTIQTSLLFTLVAAILPLALLIDGGLSQIDGIVLLSFFFYYVYWLLSKRERFSLIYHGHPVEVGKDIKLLWPHFAKVLAGVTVLLIVAQIIVNSANRFASDFGITLPLVGILIIGLGNSFPEIYFGIVAAKANKTKLLVGDVMGAIILPGTFVLGLVALFKPIPVIDLTMFAAARYFLLIAAVFFYICARTDQKITKKEAAVLLSVYIGFLLAEILAK